MASEAVMKPAPMVQWLTHRLVGLQVLRYVSVPILTYSGVLKVQWVGRKGGNVLCNDALSTIYLRYGVGHMDKNYSDSERNPTAATT